jgi:hypothetical protein
MRQVRLDFGAELVWLDPASAAAGAASWDALNNAAGPAAPIPQWIKGFIGHPEKIGGLDQIKHDGPCCAGFARIVYLDQPDRYSWLLLIKPNLAANVPADVRNYARVHAAFPNEPTFDQFFGDDQWESYRSLGECAARAIFRS